ncbi:hypothetical protein PNOK_0060300 [Pyrrhoderma noxium]|uniref:Uncharacterized protein n=1 Tax=Pyrrhoderma noxium TaxID=2282107 RepID=A0A286UVQ4_9AGAM|nr:hypothetical protein PNOK_0060300 [Pyrrhoderma noxium]
MRPSTGRFMQLLKKSAVPKNAQHRVIPPLGHPSVTPTQATLVDQLLARKEAYEKVFEIAQKSADEDCERSSFADKAGFEGTMSSSKREFYIIILSTISTELNPNCSCTSFLYDTF